MLWWPDWWTKDIYDWYKIKNNEWLHTDHRVVIKRGNDGDWLHHFKNVMEPTCDLVLLLMLFLQIQPTAASNNCLSLYFRTASPQIKLHTACIPGVTVGKWGYDGEDKQLVDYQSIHLENWTLTYTDLQGFAYTKYKQLHTWELLKLGINSAINGVAWPRNLESWCSTLKGV